MWRTQVYLTDEQVKALKRRARGRRVSMAELIRNAIEDFLKRDVDPETALDRTFGAIPNLEVPARDEWDRGYA
jgi:Arc/MetJ-type ribon-helix-helix transcriptional regulator